MPSVTRLEDMVMDPALMALESAVSSSAQHVAPPSEKTSLLYRTLDILQATQPLHPLTASTTSKR